MKAKIITTGFHVYDQKPGDYVLSGKGIMAILPCGHFFNDYEGKWQYQNIDNENKIIVTPSIFCHGKGVEEGKSEDCWHGFLIEGEFKGV